MRHQTPSSSVVTDVDCRETTSRIVAMKKKLTRLRSFSNGGSVIISGRKSKTEQHFQRIRIKGCPYTVCQSSIRVPWDLRSDCGRRHMVSGMSVKPSLVQN